MKDQEYEFTITVTDERYYNDESNYGIFSFFTNDDIPKFELYGDDPRKHSSLVGNMQRLDLNMQYKIKAEYVYNSRYGDQYKPITVTSVMPKSKDTQLIFLKSLISEKVADGLLEAYPNLVEDVASGAIETIDYTNIKGVGEKTWEKVKTKIIENYVLSDIITMLAPLGVSYKMITTLLKGEPNPALLKQKIEKNPYILTEIQGIGFSRCDSMVLKLQPKLIDSQERLVAFVNYYFTELGSSTGNTWVTENTLNEEITNYIKECHKHLKWLYDKDNKLLVKYNGKVGLKRYFDTEVEIYKNIRDRIGHLSYSINEDIINEAIKKAEEEQGFTYTEEQEYVIRSVLNSQVAFITGEAGTGKSSIWRAILLAYKLSKKEMCSTALSAMAAERITEASGFNASTIHRGLGYKGDSFEYNNENCHPADVMLMDEGSMTSSPIFLSWLRAIHPESRIVVCGDHKQLPPIGYGNIFSDLLLVLNDSGCVFHLTKPMRQALESGILCDASLIRRNKNPIKKSELDSKVVHGTKNDMVYMFRNDRTKLNEIAIKTYLKAIETDGIENVVIAIPKKQNSINSTISVNASIQDKLHGHQSDFLTYGERKFYLGDRVVQINNDYQKNVFNGMVGYVEFVSTYTKQLTVMFGDKMVNYTQNELKDLELAYALTTHKLQGSGYKTVIGIIDNTHFMLLDNCMLYTLITRAKQRCALLAEPSAFTMCIKKSHNERNTWLKLIYSTNKEIFSKL